jgi:anti-sigma factor RsiW
MNSCDEIRPQIQFYVDDELPPPEVLEVEKHLVDCASCRSEYQRQSTVVDLVRGAKPLYETSERSLRQVKALVNRHEARSGWRAPAAAAVLVGVLSLTALYFLRVRPEQAGEFAAFAADTHLEFARRAVPLDLSSSDPAEVSGWLQTRLPFHLQLPDYPAEPGQPKPYRLAGAKLLLFSNEQAGYLAYEMDGKPISLLLASAPKAAPSGGEVYRSGKLEFHFSYHKGLKVISWTDKGLHYALVTAVAAQGAESCVICHGSAAQREMIKGLVRTRPM